MSEFYSTEMESSLELQLRQLERLHKEYSKTFSVRGSFRSDMESFLDELIIEVRTSRSKVVEAANLGMVFVSSYQSAHADFQDKSRHFDNLANIAEEQQIKLQDLQRENHQLSSKLEYLSAQTTELENMIKQLNRDNDSLHRQLQLAKTEKNRMEEQVLIKQANAGIAQQIKLEEEQANLQKLDTAQENIKKYKAEISHLQFKLREVEALHQIDRNAAEKLRGTNTQLKIQNKNLNNSNEEQRSKYKTLEALCKRYQDDNAEQKSFYENLIRELEKIQPARSRRGSVLERHEEPQKPVEDIQPVESLGDFIEEEEEDPNEPGENHFFIISSPKANLNSFNFFNEKPPLTFDYLQELEIYPLPRVKQIVYGESIIVFPLLKLPTKEVKCILHTQHIDHSGVPSKGKAILVVEFMESIGVVSQSLDNFSDAGSIDSDSEESVSSTRSGGKAQGPLEIRNPIMDFFVLTCQSAKLNSPYIDTLGRIPINKLYKKVLEEAVPFNKWHDWVQNYLHRRLLKKPK